MYTPPFLYIYLFLVLNTVYGCFAQKTAVFEMFYFKDVNSTESFESVKKQKFHNVSNNVLSLGIVKSTVWVKIKLNKKLLDPASVLEINRPFIDSITLSYFLKNKKEVRESLGIAYPHSKNKFNHFVPVFDLPVENLASNEIYLKFRSRYSSLYPVQIKSKESFYKKRVLVYFIGGLAIGGLLLMGIYNLFLYFSTRDFSYMLYVLSLFSAILSQGYIFGVLIPYLSPDSPEFSYRFPVIIMACNAVFASLFTNRFLEMKETSKVFYYLLNFVVFLAILNIFIELIHLDYWSRKLNIISVINASLVVLSSAIYSLVKGNKRAVYFTIAWTIYLSGMIIFALKTIGILPYNSFTVYFMPVGTFLEVLLLSFALGHKYAIVLKEKEKLEKQTRAELEKLVTEQTFLLETSLEEKETLLKEIHHRVKNNLQIVISLLDLQIASIKDVENNKILSQSKSRVYSMSLIHQKLYQSNNLSRVDIKSYVEDLLSYLKNSYYSSKHKIEYSFAIEEKELSIDQAVPLGLIINELLTNSFKYGMLDDKINKIAVVLNFENDKLKLSIGDSGTGFNEEAIARGVKKSLGLFLIKSLTKQLRGTLVRCRKEDLFVTELVFSVKTIL